MATFSVPVVTIDDIVDHPNADALEIAVVGGFNCITRIGTYKPGDLAVYIPEASVVPEWLMRKMGLWDEEKERGMLVGRQNNRVKAIKLRGIVSQGLLYPVENGGVYGESELMGANVGDDYAEHLGITKYEPPILTNMDGEITSVFGWTLKYDIENWQRYPNVIHDGEQVVFTEKLHGTWTCFGYVPGMHNDDLFMGGTIITSKGFSDKGLAFKFNDANRGNLYMQIFEQYMVASGLWNEVMAYAHHISAPVYILGETFGPGVQDLHYGDGGKRFRVFDVYCGEPGKGQYLGYTAMVEFIEGRLPDLELVPILFAGSFSVEIAEKHRDGKDFSGSHTREGIVIKPMEERRDLEIGRAMVKMISPKYLLRKGDTTEYT